MTPLPTSLQTSAASAGPTGTSMSCNACPKNSSTLGYDAAMSINECFCDSGFYDFRLQKSTTYNFAASKQTITTLTLKCTVCPAGKYQNTSAQAMSLVSLADASGFAGCSLFTTGTVTDGCKDTATGSSACCQPCQPCPAGTYSPSAGKGLGYE